MGSKIGGIILIIVLLGVGLYIYSSGALVGGLKKLDSMAGVSSTFSFFDLIGSSTASHGFYAPVGPVAPSASSGGASGAPTSVMVGSTAINPADIPAGYTAAQLSPYFHQVRFGGVSAATIYSYGVVTLNAYFDQNATGTIDVTGWKVASNIGNEYVPQAINLYDPTGFAPASDILMKNGDTLSLYSTSAPFNLRLNECSGYIAHVADFVPSLPLTCPYVNQSQIESFTGACQNYILSVGSCQSPTLSNVQASGLGSACQSYLQNNFNYRSCFQSHITDPNFLSNQIWAWTGNNVVDSYHDTMSLFDKNGLLVDVYSY